MKVEIWSDVVCPWCYIGKRRFETALRHFAHRDEVEVTWRAFELDSHAPAERAVDYPGHLSRKYGVTVAEGQAMIDRMTATAAAEGLGFRFDIARPGSSFDAHRLSHLAAERNVEDAVVERLFSATFERGEPIGDRPTLARLGAEAGLDLAEATDVLASDAYASEVRDDQRQAAAFGISAVPFFVIDRTYGLSGAQPPATLRQALERAWVEGAPSAPRTAPGAAAPGCDDESCEV